MMIETNHPTLSIRRQCDLIGLNRSTFYWQPAGESPLNLTLIQLIDQEYTRAPFYGYPQDDRPAQPGVWLCGQPQASRSPDSKNGLTCDLSPATDDDCLQAAQEIPLSAAWTGYQSPQSGVGGRHHLHSHAPGVHVPGGYHGLVQSVCYRLAAFQYIGWGLLPGCFAPCLAARPTRHLQYRPGVQFTAHDFTHELVS